MLKIRVEQMEVLKQVMFKRFEEDMLEHIQKYFSNHWRIIGETQLRQVIQYAVKQAKQHRLTSQREVCLYLNLMLLLGSDFDTDIQLPWAKEGLMDQTITEPGERLHQVYDMAMDHLDQVAGMKGEYFDRAIIKIHHQLSEWKQLTGSGFESEWIPLLNWLYPQKSRILGEDTLSQLIRQGMTSTQVYGISTREGVILYVGLMLILGSHFDKDPKYPWFATIFNDACLTHESKVEAFYTEVSHQLDRLFEKGDR